MTSAPGSFLNSPSVAATAISGSGRAGREANVDPIHMDWGTFLRTDKDTGPRSRLANRLIDGDQPKYDKGAESHCSVGRCWPMHERRGQKCSLVVEGGGSQVDEGREG